MLAWDYSLTITHNIWIYDRDQNKLNAGVRKKKHKKSDNTRDGWNMSDNSSPKHIILLIFTLMINHYIRKTILSETRFWHVTVMQLKLKDIKPFNNICIKNKNENKNAKFWFLVVGSWTLYQLPRTSCSSATISQLFPKQ